MYGSFTVFDMSIKLSLGLRGMSWVLTLLYTVKALINHLDRLSVFLSMSLMILRGGAAQPRTTTHDGCLEAVLRLSLS